MITLRVVVVEISPNSLSQRAFAKEDHAIYGLGFQRSKEPFDEGIQIGAARRKEHWLDFLLLKDRAERLTGFGIAIHDQNSLVVQKAVFEVVQLTSRLLHPFIVRTWCATDEMNASGFQLDREQQIECDEARLRPDFNRGKVDGSQDILMSNQERRPTRRSFSFRTRIDSVLLEHARYRRI